MICLSLQKLEFKALLRAVNHAEMSEIRLDLTEMSLKEISKLFSKETNLIATCRIDIVGREACIEKLTAAISGNWPGKKSKVKKYVDIEYDAPAEYREQITALARENGFGIILSYHNFSNTDPFERLMEITGRCFEAGADIAKIATTAIMTEEGTRTLKLYKHFPPEKLLAFSMGNAGKFTRLLSLNLGAPFTFAAPTGELATAPGQPLAEEAKAAVSPKSYPHKINFKSLTPTIKAPASKSHAQRAIIAAALAKGVTNLYGYTPCNDTEAAVDLAKKIGVEVKYNPKRSQLSLKSPGSNAISLEFAKSKNPLEFNCGESGLLSKLIIPISGHLSPSREITVTGKGTLLKREYKGVAEVVEMTGINFESQNNYLPAKITGAIKGSNIQLSGKGGSQLVSGLLMALPLCPESSRIELEHPTSKPYIDLTLKTLRDFNLKITNNNYSQFIIPGRQRYRKKIFYQIQGDWSSAALLLTGAAISGNVTVKNLAINSSQADEKILDVLKLAGVEIEVTEGPKYLIMCGDVPCVFRDNPEDVDSCSGKVEIRGTRAPLNAFEVDATDSPDLFPPLVVLAINCEGESRIKGVSRLYNKESNRAETLYTEFTRLGADIEIDGDYMIIRGGRELHGGYCSSHGDHRIAMALCIAALRIKEPLHIDNMECISKSYPGFLNNFKK